jgi:hypothetical protein
METAPILNLGRRCRLIVRHFDGTTSLYTGVLLAESEFAFTIKTDRNEERSEPKLLCSVEWLSPPQKM